MVAPGQKTGHAGLDWAAYIQGLVAEHGSLTAVAAKLSAARDFAEDVGSVERGLRRLRGRGHHDGGVWGQRALAVFGLSAAAKDRVRWMGHYHSRFTDLPTSVCAELLAIWNRPPVSESRPRVWVYLGLANVALRRREGAYALGHLSQVRLGLATAPAAARAEYALVAAYAVGHDRADEVAEHLRAASEALAESGIDAADHACLVARRIDQQAYPLNKPRSGKPDHEAALELYEQIPTDGPPFALCRRENGMGWSSLRLGQRDRAVEHARTSVSVAGDSGSLRLRAMALNLLAAALGPCDGGEPRRRAAAIAAALEDEELRARFARPLL